MQPKQTLIRFYAVVLMALSCVLASVSAGAETNTADVIVYGSTPGGYCAAIAAAREGASVILLEPTAHIGGMNTGGLSFSDSNQMYRETLMGLFHEWHLRIQQDYESRGITLPYDVNVKDTSRWSYEPHVAMQVTTQMLAEAGVEVLTRRWLGSVTKSGSHIESLVTTSNDTFIADTFVDGSYEGDLMAAAGVSWTIDREGTADFGESYAGKQYPKALMNIDGFDTNGVPLPLTTTTNAGPVDAGDDNIMTYSFRLSLTTDAGNKVAMPAPDSYDPARFEVMRRYVQGGGSSIGYGRLDVPNSKKDGNNAINKQFSTGFVGGAKGWATADEAGRGAIFEAHKQYTLEFIHFLSTDPVFSASERNSIAQWGLCADEFADTGHFPPYLYVRESRRMQGMYVITQGDIIDDPVKADAISVSSFPIDSHDCQRIAYPGGGVRNEGTIYPVKPSGSNKGYPYHVPYRAILPMTNECNNLLVPVALSCTHVAISSLRIEGAWMVTGQSAGIAAAMAADRGVTVQDLPYDDLKARILAQGQVLDLPDGFGPEPPLAGIVLDDPEAELASTWSASVNQTPYVGDGYRYAGTAGTPNDGSAMATWRFTAATGGVYQLNMAYSPGPTRATNVPLTVASGPYVTSFTVDQTVPRPAGSVVRAIGTVELVTDQETVITVGTSNTTGFVILDAIQLVLDTPAVEKPSVLFINVDDWNDWNEVLQGHAQAITPNIERLAERGVAFNNAICASPMCFPSRSALFTGIHPSKSGNIANDNTLNSWRTYTPDAVTIPKHLSGQGWQSIGIGKNFHNGNAPEFDEYISRGAEPAVVPGSVVSSGNASGYCAYSAEPTTNMPDYIAVSHGIDRLNTVSEPLFLSLGIYRPHVPWVVPQEYFDLYPLDEVQYPVHQTGDVDDLPERLQLLARGEAKFGTGYHDMLVANGYDKHFIRAYLACVTFADEQLGRLLDAWDASPHSTNGYIVLWSDHGYMLSEKQAWSKMKPWYDSARCNLIIAGPDIPTNEVCAKAVSLQDLYPTVLDLLDLPSPPQQIDGNSLVPLLEAPDAEWNQPVVMSSEADGIRYDTVLHNDYRMTRLITGETELYHLASDPHEFNNLATNPVYTAVITNLSQHLTFSYPDIPQDGWVEAEAIPRQSSADYGVRGNCNFPKAVAGASGGQVICADLEAGGTSYIDFVLDLGQAGTYDLGATLSAGGSCSVFIGDVVEDAAQADAGYPMTALGTVPGGAGGLSEVALGTVTFDQPGLKLMRFMSNVSEQRLLIDRIQLLEALPVTGLYFQEGVSPTAAYTHEAVYIRSGDPSTNFNGDSDQELIVGYTTSGEELRALLEFDVRAIPASDVIDAVSLILRTEAGTTGLGGDITLNAHGYSFDIDENTATWDAPGSGDSTAGGTLGPLLTSATFAATAEGLDVTFDDTVAFRTAVSDAVAGDGFLRLILARADASGSGHRFARFDDETVTPAGNRPELIVVARPAGTVFGVWCGGGSWPIP